jgi:hypothetical protein
LEKRSPQKQQAPLCPRIIQTSAYFISVAKPKASTGSGRSKPKNTVPQFEFINLSPGSNDADKTTMQTVVRRHVKLRKVAQTPAKMDMEIHKIDEHTASFVQSKSNIHQIPGVDPFDCSPARLTPYMHDLLTCCMRHLSLHVCPHRKLIRLSPVSTTMWKQLYSLERLAGYNPVTEYWLPLAFRDEAVLHSFIGCAEAFAMGYKSFNDESRGLWHLQKAISIVNHRIVADGDSAVTGGTLIIVVGMAMVTVSRIPIPRSFSGFQSDHY